MTVIGAVGDMLIEHWSVLDAFYMSVITISTVGYGAVKPLSPSPASLRNEAKNTEMFVMPQKDADEVYPNAN